MEVGSKAERELQIPAAVKRIVVSLEKLHALIMEVQNRLEPVSTQVEISKPKDPVGTTNTVALTTHGAELETINASIKVDIDALTSIRNRLEI